MGYGESSVMRASAAVRFIGYHSVDAPECAHALRESQTPAVASGFHNDVSKLGHCFTIVQNSGVLVNK
jgi:hypothetical protein